MIPKTKEEVIGKIVDSFLKENEIILTINQLGNLLCPTWDNEKHYAFQCIFEAKEGLHGTKFLETIFYQSLALGKKKPTKFQVLSSLCIDIWSDFFQFCSYYNYPLVEARGYRNDHSYELYSLANIEARKVNKFFTPEQLKTIKEIINEY